MELIRDALWLSVIIFLSVVTKTDQAREVLAQINSKRWTQFVSERFLSFTIDPEVLLSTQISNAGKNMAKGLSPCFLRVGGPSTNKMTYQEHLTEPDNFTITEEQWSSLNQFTSEVGQDLIVCLNSNQRKHRVWDSRNALELISASNRSHFNLGWQFGYAMSDSPEIKGIELGRDTIRLRKILDTFTWYRKSPILAPGITSCKTSQEINFIKELLNEAGSSIAALPVHIKFGDENEDAGQVITNSITNIESNVWKDNVFLKAGSPRKPLWIAEDEPGSGSFGDAMAWIKRLGNAAKLGIQVVMHQPSPISLNYPTPDFWASVLFKNLVGRAVLEARLVTGNKTQVHLFSHCTAKVQDHNSILDQEKKYESGAVTVFGVNQGKDYIELSMRGASMKEEPLHLYILTEDRKGKRANPDEVGTLFNGQRLQLSPVQGLPILSPKVKKPTRTLNVNIPGRSIFFIVFPEMKARVCQVNPIVQHMQQFEDLTSRVKLPGLNDEGGSSEQSSSPKNDSDEQDDQVYVNFERKKKIEKPPERGPLKDVVHPLNEFLKFDPFDPPRPPPLPRPYYRPHDDFEQIKYVTFNDNDWLSGFPDAIAQKNASKPEVKSEGAVEPEIQRLLKRRRRAVVRRNGGGYEELIGDGGEVKKMQSEPPLVFPSHGQAGPPVYNYQHQEPQDPRGMRPHTHHFVTLPERTPYLAPPQPSYEQPAYPQDEPRYPPYSSMHHMPFAPHTEPGHLPVTSVDLKSENPNRPGPDGTTYSTGGCPMAESEEGHYYHSHLASTIEDARRRRARDLTRLDLLNVHINREKHLFQYLEELTTEGEKLIQTLDALDKEEQALAVLNVKTPEGEVDKQNVTSSADDGIIKSLQSYVKESKDIKKLIQEIEHLDRKLNATFVTKEQTSEEGRKNRFGRDLTNKEESNSTATGQLDLSGPDFHAKLKISAPECSGPVSEEAVVVKEPPSDSNEGGEIIESSEVTTSTPIETTEKNSKESLKPKREMVEQVILENKAKESPYEILPPTEPPVVAEPQPQPGPEKPADPWNSKISSLLNIKSEPSKLLSPTLLLQDKPQTQSILGTDLLKPVVVDWPKVTNQSKELADKFNQDALAEYINKLHEQKEKERNERIESFRQRLQESRQKLSALAAPDLTDPKLKTDLLTDKDFLNKLKGGVATTRTKRRLSDYDTLEYARNVPQYDYGPPDPHDEDLRYLIPFDGNLHPITINNREYKAKLYSVMHQPDQVNYYNGDNPSYREQPNQGMYYNDDNLSYRGVPYSHVNEDVNDAPVYPELSPPYHGIHHPYHRQFMDAPEEPYYSPPRRRFVRNPKQETGVVPVIVLPSASDSKKCPLPHHSSRKKRDVGHYPMFKDPKTNDIRHMMDEDTQLQTDDMSVESVPAYNSQPTEFIQPVEETSSEWLANAQRLTPAGPVPIPVQIPREFDRPKRQHNGKPLVVSLVLDKLKGLFHLFEALLGFAGI